MNDKTVINRLTVRLLGKDYTIKTDKPSERVTEISKQLNDKLESVAQRFPRLTNVDVSLLVCLSLMDEIEKLKDEKRELWELLGEATKKD